MRMLGYWVRARHVVGVLALQGVLAVIIAGWGAVTVEVPARTVGGAAPVGVWLLASLPAAVAIAVGLVSRQADQEEVTVRPLSWWDGGYLVGAAVVVSALFVAAYRVGGVGDAAPAALRNTFLLLGLALISGRIWQRSLSWVLPMTVMLPMLYFGFGRENRPQWWALLLRDFDAGSAVGAGAVFLVGVLAALAGPWERRFIRQRWGSRWRRRLPAP